MRRHDGAAAPIRLLDDFFVPGIVGLIATALLSLFLDDFLRGSGQEGDRTLARFAVNLFQCAVLFFCFRRLARLQLSALFVRVRRDSLGWALLSGASCMTLLVLLGSLLQWFSRSPQMSIGDPEVAVDLTDLAPFQSGQMLDLFLQFTLVALAAPVVEEIYFRGVLFGWLRQRLAVGWAVLWSALIFALFHGKIFAHPDLWGVFDTVAIMISGMVMAGLYQRSGSLWPSVVMHGGYNATALLLSLTGA